MHRHQCDEMREVLKKYLEQEKELEKRIQECHELKSKDSTQNKIVSPIASSRYKYEESQARNRQLLKDLEKSKAILRTESTFTPTEQELRDLAATYRKSLLK